MTESGPAAPTCSARGCSEPAVWSLLWNNPKLHASERRKVWLACDAHSRSLQDFLTARSFLRGVEPFEVGSATEPD